MALLEAAKRRLNQGFVGEWWFNLGKGNIPGWSIVNILGNNTEISLTTDPEDISNVGGILTWSTTDDIDSISSSSTADTQIVLVTGLDSSWNRITQTATLNGQNKVTLSTPLIRFESVVIISGATNDGAIYIYVDSAITNGVPNDDTKIRGKMCIGNGISQHGLFSVPAGHTAFLVHGYMSQTGIDRGNADMKQMLRTFGGPELVVGCNGLTAAGSTSFYIETPYPFTFEEKSDVWARCQESSVIGMGVCVGFRIVLVNNSYLLG